MIDAPARTCFFSESFEPRPFHAYWCAVMRHFETKVGIWCHRRNAAVLHRRAIGGPMWREPVA